MESRRTRQFKELVQQARTTNLIEYLMRLGHHPVGPVKRRAMFHSPLRVDNNPSFTVNEKDGIWVWYDFGTGDHGDGIAFVMRYRGLDFREAVEELTGQRAQLAPVLAPKLDRTPDKTRLEKTMDVRALYRSARLRTGDAERARISEYFARYQLPLYPELEAAVLTWQGIPYVAIPIPNFPRLRGLECRALDPKVAGEDCRRRTFGQKTLWVLKRDAGRMLVTESIVDSIAGDQLYPDWTFTLVALNGVANVEKLDGLATQLKPKAVWLALDNDKERPELKGPGAEKRAAELLAAKGVEVHHIHQHHAYGVKDLGALWPIVAAQQQQKKGA
jgi:hypothetical protein